MFRSTPLVLPVLLVALACAGPPQPEEPIARAPQPEPAFERDWELLPDADALRAEYGARDDFAELCELNRPLKDSFEALAAEDWPRLRALSNAFLSRCPVDIDFHLLLALALSEENREAEAAQHNHWRHALVESVLHSGTGRSIDSPWVVISVGEEYAVLRALGMRRESQSLLDGGIDALTVSVDGESVTVYFFPESHWARMDRLFQQ